MENNKVVSLSSKYSFVYSPVVTEGDNGLKTDSYARFLLMFLMETLWFIRDYLLLYNERKG